jgi:hypothetical protein
MAFVSTRPLYAQQSLASLLMGDLTYILNVIVALATRLGLAKNIWMSSSSGFTAGFSFGGGREMTINRKRKWSLHMANLSRNCVRYDSDE